MGLRALYNGVVTFTDVRVPRENMIAKEGQGIEGGPNDFEYRPPDDSGGVRRSVANGCSKSARKWASERVQWGVPIGQHYAIAGKIAEMAGNVFAMEAITFLTSALVDRKAGDLRIETAMCKMWATEATWRIADEAMQVRGGRGYETAAIARGPRRGTASGRAFPARLPHQYDLRRFERNHAALHCARSARSASQSGRRDFQHAAADSTTRAKAVFSSGKFYASWYPKQWMGGTPGDLDKLHADLRPHVHYAAGASKRLARGLFHAMTRFGPKLDREQLLLSRFVGIATELVCDERDLRVRAAQDRERRAGRGSSFGRDLFLPLGEDADRHAFCRHVAKCRPRRLRSDPGADGREQHAESFARGSSRQVGSSSSDLHPVRAASIRLG